MEYKAVERYCGAKSLKGSVEEEEEVEDEDEEVVRVS